MRRRAPRNSSCHAEAPGIRLTERRQWDQALKAMSRPPEHLQQRTPDPPCDHEVKGRQRNSSPSPKRATARRAGVIRPILRIEAVWSSATAARPQSSHDACWMMANAMDEEKASTTNTIIAARRTDPDRMAEADNFTGVTRARSKRPRTAGLSLPKSSCTLQGLSRLCVAYGVPAFPARTPPGRTDYRRRRRDLHPPTDPASIFLGIIMDLMKEGRDLRLPKPRPPHHRQRPATGGRQSTDQLIAPQHRHRRGCQNPPSPPATQAIRHQQPPSSLRLPRPLRP